MFAAKRLDEFLPVAPEMRRLLLPTTFPMAFGHPALKEDRELGPCQWFFACTIKQSQLVDETVQSGTEIMSDFTDPDAQFQWWKDVYASAKRVLSGFRLQLGYDNSIVGLCPKTSISQTERFDLTYCTPDLETWAIERVHEVCSDHERRQPAGRAEAENPEGRAIPSMGAP
jgi:hypothetical protein